MKAITLHAPYGTLIALGVKRIETRSWATKHRGPIAIHQAVRVPAHGIIGRFSFGRLGDGSVVMDDFRDGDGLSHPRHPLPLGAVVATANLVDCVPMVDSWPSHRGDGCLFVGGPEFVGYESMAYFASGRPTFPSRNVEDQRPFGDFAPGRWAWLMEDVKPTTDLCPACMYRGPIQRRRSCYVCDDRGFCDPVPAKGKQGMWTWEP